MQLLGEVRAQTIPCGELRIQVSPKPLSFVIAAKSGDVIQRLTVKDGGEVLFQSGGSPMLGLGEGGAAI